METFIPISNENGKMPIIRQLMLVMATMRITKMNNNNKRSRDRRKEEPSDPK